MTSQKMITILGPTASGKTTVAALLAHRCKGEVISADSRQVYRGMDLGTGKDYDDYTVNGRPVPFHLIDIRDAGYEYSIFEYRRDFAVIYDDIRTRGRLPVLCGGSGMYLEAVLSNYQMADVPVNTAMRSDLADLTDDELLKRLSSLKKLHSTTDTTDRSRMLRAIEIAVYQHAYPDKVMRLEAVPSQIFGIAHDRAQLRERITKRLQQRLDSGMTDEVRKLLDKGLSPERLKTYGLEYKYLTMFITGELTYDGMFSLLNTAIHQFAKRQMTWFRRMERNGHEICWLNGSMGPENMAELIINTAGLKNNEA